MAYKQGDEATLIAALAAGKTQQEAAAAANTSPRTVSRRLQDPAFRAQIAVARSEMLSRTVGLLAEVSSRAVATLGDLLNAETESVRLGAARTALEQAAKLREHVEHGDQLRELREQVAALTAGASR